jgi:hypothetical protein
VVCFNLPVKRRNPKKIAGELKKRALDLALTMSEKQRELKIV